MSEPRNRSAKKRLFMLLLIFALPLVPAVVVQKLVRRSPPGEAITPVMSEIIAAMQVLPQPVENAPPLHLETRFSAGEVYIFDVDRSVEIGRPPASRSRRSFRLEVLDISDEGARLRLSPAEAGAETVLGRTEIVFRWENRGFLDVESSGPIIRDLRDQLLKTHGIILPGPFERQVAEQAWIEPPGMEASPELKELLAGADLHVGREEMPHRGGLMAEKAMQDQRDFRVLGYRRFALEDPNGEKMGVYERVTRGRMVVPESALAPGEGAIRIREILKFEHAQKSFDGEIEAVVSQRVRLLSGEDER